MLLQLVILWTITLILNLADFSYSITLDLLIFLFPKTFQLFGSPIFWLWVYLL